MLKTFWIDLYKVEEKIWMESQQDNPTLENGGAESQEDYSTSVVPKISTVK